MTNATRTHPVSRRSLLTGGAVIAFMFSGPALAQEAGVATSPSTAAAPAQPAVSSQPAASSQAAASAAAPAASSGALDDIVVTARRRAESLISVPVAVTALGSAELQRYGTPDLKKIGQLAPQVIIAQAGSGAGASFTIRGIGSPATDVGIQQSVALNIDGVMVSRGRFVRLGTFDLQQVEVLKGPQSLFFGKNSPAGVISMTSTNPTDHVEGYVRAGYEFVADEKYVEAAIGGPITENLRARIAVRDSAMKGWVRNTAPAQANPFDPANPLPGALGVRQPADKELIGRLTVVYDPSDRFDATLKATGGRLRTNTDSGATQAVCAPGIAHPTTFGVVDTSDDCKLDQQRSSSAIPLAYLKGWPGPPANGKPLTKQEAAVASLTMNYKLDNVTFTSVSGFLYLNTRGFDEFTYTGTSRIWGYNTEKSHQYSEELRAVTDFDSPINVTVGGYYERNDIADPSASLVAFVGPDPQGQYLSYITDIKSHGQTLSAFAQARWKILDNLELAGGVRYTHETRNLTRLQDTYVHPGLPFLPVGKNITGRFADSNYSPEATLTWHPTRTSTLYAAYKTGYKSGGFSQPGNIAANANADNLRFGSETASGGEVGYKADLLNHHLRVELTAYSYDFNNLQLTSFNAATLGYTLRNAAKARTRGVELSTEWRATRELSLRGGFGYNQARYLSFPGSPCYSGQTAAQGCIVTNGVPGQDLTGTPLTRAPDWVFNMGANYTKPVTDDLDLALSLDGDHTSSYYAQENHNPVSIQKAFWRLNASVRLTSKKMGWELAVIGRNLTNSYYMVASVDKPGGTGGTIGAALQRPREVALQATYRF